MAEEASAARTVGRRGILAAAGAVVAGIAAKQTTVPVAAAYMLQGDTSNVAAATTLIAPVSFFSNAPVLQIANGFLFDFPAIPDAIQATAAPNAAAALRAIHHDAGDGVIGQSPHGVGARGTSESGAGVQGQVPATVSGGGANTAANTIAVVGTNLSTGANGIGVYGLSDKGTGVYGQTNASFNYGVLGTTYVPSSTAIAGTCTGNGSSAFSGGTGNANAFAAYFQGHVQVDGPFDVIGAGNKHAAVAHPDGSHRTVYSVESAEAWLEDFGTGTLTGGKAEVKLDADFAALIHTEDYHVFLTSHGDYHVHTPQRSATGFTVQVTSGAGIAAKGATTVGGTFSWRVVARPKTTAKVDRLAKVRVADAKVLLPDPTKLPKPVFPPVAAAPPKP